MNDRKHMAIILGIVSILIVMAVYWNTGTLWRNQYDDAYITYRYAVNLAEHGALEFNLGERTDAASSFLYTVILAGFYRIGWHDMEMVSFLLNMFALSVITAFVYLCAFRLSNIQWVAIALGLVASLQGFISGWSVLGMDTVPFAALLCALAWAIIERRNRLALALIIAVIFMRIEGLIMVPFWWLTTGRRIREGLLVAGVIFLFYFIRFVYYDTILPHSYYSKNVIVYYHSQPWNIIYLWKNFAFIVPSIAITGMVMDKRVRWLGIYVVIGFMACLAGPNSDWGRYTSHLFPLMIICSAILFQRAEMIAVVFSILLIQGTSSIQFMNFQCSQVSKSQGARLDAGQWLEKNADKSRHVISSDIGAIAYKAINMKFIDLMGLTSSDVLRQYQNNKNADTIIQTKNPGYIADTFHINGKDVVYLNGDGKFFRSGKSTTIPESLLKIVWGKKFADDLAIIITGAE